MKREKRVSPPKIDRSKVEAKREDQLGKGKVPARPMSANRGKKIRQGELGYEHLNKELDRKIKAL